MGQRDHQHALAAISMYVRLQPAWEDPWPSHCWVPEHPPLAKGQDYIHLPILYFFMHAGGRGLYTIGNFYHNSETHGHRSRSIGNFMSRYTSHRLDCMKRTEQKVFGLASPPSCHSKISWETGRVSNSGQQQAWYQSGNRLGRDRIAIIKIQADLGSFQADIFCLIQREGLVQVRCSSLITKDPSRWPALLRAYTLTLSTFGGKGVYHY